MFKKITLLFLSTAMFLLLFYANTSAGTYDFGYSGGSANTYFGVSYYALGNVWYTPINYTILAINPGSSPYGGNLTDDQIIRLTSQNGYPEDASLVAPQNTWYPGLTVGAWNTTDYRVTSGCYNAVMQYYETSTYGSPMAWFTYQYGGIGATLYDQNGTAYGTTITAGLTYQSGLPMTTSYYFEYYPYYLNNTLVRYAPPVSVSAQIMTGSGTCVQSGTQTPSLPAGQIWYNGSTGFTITAGAGQYITNIVVNGNTNYGFQASPYTLNLTNITSNWNLQIYFGYNVVLATGGTTISAVGYPSGFQYFPAGAIIQYNIAPQYAGAKITLITISDRDNPSTSFTIPITNNGYGQSITIGNHTLPSPFDVPLSLNCKITAQGNIPIDVSAGPHGQITNPGVLLYSYNSNTFIIITPDPHYKFDQILVDGINKIDANGNSLDPNLAIQNTPTTSATYTFKNIISPRSIHAEFYAHSVKYNITGTGLGGSVNPPSPNPLHVNDNVTLYYQIIPLPDYKINYLSWTDGTSTWNAGVPYPQHGEMDISLANVVNDMTISTSFTIALYTVTVIRHNGGQIVPYGTIDPVSQNGTIVVNSGTTMVFTITADAASHIVDVLVNGVSQGPVKTYTMNSIRANATIEAIYAKDTYPVYGVAGPHGTIFPVDTVVDSGSLIDVVVTPDRGYKISVEQLNGVTKNPETEFQILNIKTSQTVTATFVSTPIHIIMATGGQGGTISPSGNVSVNEGLDQKFTMTPDKGYMIVDVLVDGTSVGPVTSYTFTDVTTDHTISVTFAMIPVPAVTCSLNSTPLVSGVPFSMTIKLTDQNTGNPYDSPADVPVMITSTGGGVLSGTTTGILSKSASQVTIDGIIYTNDNGEVNVQINAGVQGYKACSCPTTVMAKEPLVQENDLESSNITVNGMTIKWTNGDGTKRIGLLKPMSAIDPATELPVDGTNYTTNTAYGSGQQLGTNGCYVIFNGTGASVDITNLVLGTTYYAKFCGYNGDGATANYNVNDGMLKNPNDWMIEGVNDNNAVYAKGFEISNVAPNPVVNDLHFTFTTGKTIPVTIELLDVTGRRAITAYDGKTFDIGSTQIDIPVNNLASGVYILKVSSGNDFAITSITIVR